MADKKKRERPRRGRGEGNIEELPSGKFRAVLSAGVDPVTKKRNKLTYTADTKKEVMTWMCDQQDKQNKGQLAHAGKKTLGGWITEWLVIHKAKVSPKTYSLDDYRAQRHLLPRFGEIPLDRLNSLELTSRFAAMASDGVSLPERHKARKLLRTCLREAVRHRLIHSDPAQDVKLPKLPAARHTCLDSVQAGKLIEASRPHRLAALIDMALDAALRPGEMYALQWSDVDLDAGTVNIRQTLEFVDGVFRLKEPKTTASRRKLMIAPRTVDSLRAHRDRMREEGRDVEAGQVFVDSRGGFLREQNVQNRFLHVLTKRACLPAMRVYDLRHTCATLLLSRDVNVKVVSERMGHESIEITLKHYAHALPSMQTRAIEVVTDLFGTLPIVPQESHKVEQEQVASVSN